MAFETILNHPDRTVDVDGLKFFVSREVFDPDPSISYSTQMVLDNLPDLKGKRVLDMGCGCGALAIHAVVRGAIVTASDIDPKAIADTKLNVQKNNAHITTVVSDLFENIHGEFDYVLANLPINENRWTLNDSTNNIVRRFIEEVQNHLSPKGVVLLTWLSIQPVDPIRKLISSNGFVFIEKSCEKFGFTWYLFKISKN